MGRRRERERESNVEHLPCCHAHHLAHTRTYIHIHSFFPFPPPIPSTSQKNVSVPCAPSESYQMASLLLLLFAARCIREISSSVFAALQSSSRQSRQQLQSTFLHTTVRHGHHVTTATEERRGEEKGEGGGTRTTRCFPPNHHPFILCSPFSLSLPTFAQGEQRERGKCFSLLRPPPCEEAPPFNLRRNPPSDVPRSSRPPLPSLSHFSRSIPPYPTSPPKAFAVHTLGKKKKGVCVTAARAVVVREGASRKTIFFMERERLHTSGGGERRHNRPMCNKSIPPPRRAPAAGIMQAVRRYRRGPLRGGGGKRKGPIRRLIDDDVEGGFASPQSPRNFLWLLRENPPEEVAKKRKGGLFGAGERQGNVR